jgi:hypothetical protein
VGGHDTQVTHGVDVISPPRGILWFSKSIITAQKGRKYCDMR